MFNSYDFFNALYSTSAACFSALLKVCPYMSIVVDAFEYLDFYIPCKAENKRSVFIPFLKFAVFFRILQICLNMNI